VADVLGAGVVGHWVAPGERNIPRPNEWVKIDRNMIQEVQNPHPSGAWMGPPQDVTQDQELSKDTEDARSFPDFGKGGVFSFRLMEPMEEVVYLDAVKLVAV